MKTETLMTESDATPTAEQPPTGGEVLLWIVGAAIYFIWPIDIIPDFLLGPGQVDDLGVAGWAAIKAVKWACS